uniref:G protein-coupled receptor n=1 Tax=Gongylonema pulchrum TaxID=637853 RepID=A0A183D734_9BILA
LREVFTPRYIYFVIAAMLLTDSAMVWLIVPVLKFSIEKIDVNHIDGFDKTVIIKLKHDDLYRLVAFCSVLFLILLVSYAVISFTVKRMLQTLNSNSLSIKTHIMQRQLVILMFLQAFLPVIFLIIPLLLLVIFVTTKLEVDIYGTSAFAMLYWEPCINPVLSLYYIKPFRQQLKRIVRIRRNVRTADVKSAVFVAVHH